MKNQPKTQWQNSALLVGVGVVAVWSFYLGAAALFKDPIRSGDNREGGKAREARVRGGSAGQAHLGRTNSPSRKSSGAAADADQLVADTQESSSPKQDSAVAPVSDPPVVASHVAVTHTKDPRAVLRERIMEEAFSLAMRSDSPWKNLLAIATVHYSRGDHDAARDILLMAEKMATDPDGSVDSSASVSAVVKVMLAQKLNDDAVAALQNIQSRSEREQAVSNVAVWSAGHGRVDLARGLISQLVNAPARDTVLVAIAESEAAYEGASVAMQTVNSIVGAKKKDDAYRRIALKRAYLNDFSHADQAVQLVQNDTLKNTTLTSLARQRIRNGDSTGGLDTLQYVNDPAMADRALREVSADLARLGDFSLSAYVSTRIRGEDQRSHALELLSIEQARSGDLSGSLVRTSAIPVKSVRNRALKSVSAVTADIGEPRRARNVAVRINSSKVRDQAYRAIAQASAVDGDHTAAYNTLQEIGSPDEKALALVAIARTKIKHGAPRQALLMLEDARREALAVTSVTTLDRIQSDMAIAYAERDESDQSLLLAKTIISPSRRDVTYGSLAKTMIRLHDLHAAQQSIESISSRSLRLKAEDDVARSFAIKVTPQEAVRSSRALRSSRQRIIFLLEVSRKT